MTPRKPGRKTAGTLSIVPTTPEGEVIVDERPIPPPGLSDRAIEIWEQVVDDLPASWFPRHTHEVLAAYCRHSASIERLDSLIAQTEQGDDNGQLDLDRLALLLKLRANESRTMQAHARSLRLTVQATKSADVKKPSPRKAPKPWES